MFAGVFDLEFHVGGEIGECGVHAVGGEDEVDDVFGSTLADAEWNLVFGHGELFVGHPGGDFFDFFDVSVDVAGALDDRMEAVEHGAAGELGPGERGGGI